MHRFSSFLSEQHRSASPTERSDNRCKHAHATATVGRIWGARVLTSDIARDAARICDVVDAGSPLVLFVHGVEPDEVLLCVAGHLGASNNGTSCDAQISGKQSPPASRLFQRETPTWTACTVQIAIFFHRLVLALEHSTLPSTENII